MTDRVKGFIVTLENDMRVDDVDSIMSALSMVRGVADVTAIKANADDYINRMQIRVDMEARIWKALKGEKA